MNFAQYLETCSAISVALETPQTFGKTNLGSNSEQLKMTLCHPLHPMMILLLLMKLQLKMTLCHLLSQLNLQPLLHFLCLKLYSYNFIFIQNTFNLFCIFWDINIIKKRLWFLLCRSTFSFCISLYDIINLLIH